MIKILEESGVFIRISVRMERNGKEKCLSI
jgi:hypothetical protein